MLDDITVSDQEAIFPAVEQIILEHIGESISLQPETHLLEDLQIDSIELIEIGVNCEKAFHLSFPDAELRQCKTVGDIAELVKRTRQKEVA